MTWLTTPREMSTLIAGASREPVLTIMVRIFQCFSTSALASSLRRLTNIPSLRCKLIKTVRQCQSFALGSVGLSTPLLALPSPVEAQLVICSRKIDRHLDVAIGYAEGGQWVSEGWWKVPPSDCITPVGGNLRVRYYYIRGVEWNTGKSWSQNISFCTDSTAFKIYGDQECESRGYKQEDFFSIRLCWRRLLSRYHLARESIIHSIIY